LLTSTGKPHNISEALENDMWHKAMQEEYDALHAQKQNLSSYGT
jgi:hypothetical protein